jgi:anti-sigma factor RsiW
MNCDRAQLLTDAYMDDEIGVAFAGEFERHLESCALCSDNLARRRLLRQALREKLGYFPAPSALHQRIADALPREAGERPRPVLVSRSVAPRWMALAASLVLAASLGSAVTYYGTPRDTGLVADEVFASHVRNQQSPDRAIDIASSDEHTVKPWLDARLDFAAPVKDLAAAGYPLVGGRVDYINGRAVAALVYRYQKHVITLFVWPGDGKSRSLATSLRRGDHLAEWSDKDMTYWAISDLAAPEFDTFVRRFQAAEVMEPPASSR